MQNTKDAGAIEVDGPTVVFSQPNLLQETVRTLANSKSEAEFVEPQGPWFTNELPEPYEFVKHLAC